MSILERYFSDCTVQKDISRRNAFDLRYKNRIVEWQGIVVQVLPAAVEISFDNKKTEKKQVHLHLHLLPSRMEKSKHLFQIGKYLRFRAKLLSPEYHSEPIVEAELARSQIQKTSILDCSWETFKDDMGYGAVDCPLELFSRFWKDETFVFSARIKTLHFFNHSGTGFANNAGFFARASLDFTDLSTYFPNEPAILLFRSPPLQGTPLQIPDEEEVKQKLLSIEQHGTVLQISATVKRRSPVHVFLLHQIEGEVELEAPRRLLVHRPSTIATTSPFAFPPPFRRYTSEVNLMGGATTSSASIDTTPILMDQSDKGQRRIDALRQRFDGGHAIAPSHTPLLHRARSISASTRPGAEGQVVYTSPTSVKELTKIFNKDNTPAENPEAKRDTN